MKKLFVFLVLAAAAFGQGGQSTPIINGPSLPVGAKDWSLFALTTGTTGLYQCQHSPTCTTSGQWFFLGSSGSGVNITVNGGSNISSPVNFENGAATDGISINFNNPSGSNVTAGISGALTSAGLNITPTTCTNQFINAISSGGVGTCATVANAALANSATTVNSQTCTLGSTCTIPEQVNSSNMTSQAGFNLETSTANAVGLTVTPTNSATNVLKFEITGVSYTGNAATASNLSGCSGSTAGDICYYTGSAWARLAGNASGTLFLQETSSGVPSWASASGGPGTGTQYDLAGWATTSTLGSSGPTTGYDGVPQIPSGSTTSGAFTAIPTFAPQGVTPNPQTGTTYTYLLTDRVKYVSFSNSSSIAVVLPQAGSSGFGLNWTNVSCDIGTGTATITPTTSTISYTTGTAYTSGASSLALTTGQCAWIYSDNTNYFAIVRSGSGGGDTITSPNSTLAVGGTSTNTTLDLEGSAGEIMAGATPALTYTPSLGKSGTAGTLSLYPASGNFTTTLGSAATASNTVNFFASVPTNLHLFYCAVSSTTCTLTDAGYAYNSIPYADLSITAANIGTLFNIAQYDTIYSNGTSAAPLGAAINGFQYDSTSGAPAAATAANLGALANIASGLIVYSGGTSSALVGSTDWSATATTLTAAAAGVLNMSAVTGAAGLNLPQAVGSNQLSGTVTANLSAPIVIQNTNSTNNNTSITMGVTAPGTSTGQTVLNVNGASTGGDLVDFGTGGTWASGVLSGQTIVAAIKPTGQLNLGTAPSCAGSPTAGGPICSTTGTGPTPAANVGDWWPDSTVNAFRWNVNNMTQTQQLPQTTVLHSNFTNSNTTFTTVSDGTRSWSWAVAASADYKLDCTFYYEGATATSNDPTIQITGPSTPTAVSYGVEGYNGTTFVSANAQSFSTSLDPFSTLASDTAVYMAHVHLSLANGSNAGTVALQAKNTTGTDVMTIYGGSSCTFQ